MNRYARYEFPTARRASMGPSNVLLLNRKAAEILDADGATEMAIICDPETGVVSIKPLEIPNCVGVVSLLSADGSQGQARLHLQPKFAPDMKKGEHYRCRWNDVDGQLEITTELAVAQEKGGK
jgi:hypothetical protein